jgi:hypothetical protein
MPRFIYPKFFYNLLYNWPVQLLENAFPYASCLILIKKELHAKLKGFDEKIKIAEDHDYARRAARVSKFGFLRSSKLPLFMRRCREKGIINTNLKYLVCNLFNVSLGEVKSDIFGYDFGQCRSSVSENGNSPKKLGFVFQFLWTIAYYIVSGLGLIGWLMFLLVLAPKLISFKIKGLFSWSDESELLKTDRVCAISGKAMNPRAEVHPVEVSSSNTAAKSNCNREECPDEQPVK